MNSKGQSKGKKYPKIYSIHSQKGGVGKTSIAIAIAGLESIFNKKKVLLIDADLTGTSIKDILVRKISKDEKSPLTYTYINELILATPNDFGEYTLNISKKTRGKSKSSSGLHDFYYKSEIDPNIFFSPSSPAYSDVLEIIPLISQEDYLHFFRHRFEDIIVTAINDDDFEVIILDLSPGFHGLSKNICDMMFEQIVNKIKVEEKKETETPRLESLLNYSQPKGEKALDSRVLFVTTSDKPDYGALIPLFSSYMLDEHQKKSFYYKNSQPHEKKEKISFENLLGAVDFVFNKVKSAEGEVLDPAKVMRKIFDDLYEISRNGDKKNNLPDVIGLIEERVKKLEAVSCENIPSFEMGGILPTIKKLYSTQKEGKEMPAVDGMAGWCINISKTLDITELKEIEWAE